METQRFLFQDLKSILVDRVGIAEHVVRDDPTLTFEEMGLDSLAIVELQLAIQQKYSIPIADNETAHIKTIGGTIDFTNRRIAETESSSARAH